jgi:hypothetical protein
MGPCLGRKRTCHVEQSGPSAQVGLLAFLVVQLSIDENFINKRCRPKIPPLRLPKDIPLEHT